MALVSGQRSTLNPNAPIFIPSVYRQVEDFSPEWWELVKTSTWFRDFWLSEHPEGSFVGGAVSDGDENGFGDFFSENFDLEFDAGLADLEDQFEELINLTEDEEKKKPLNGVKLDLKVLVKELSIPDSSKWRNVESPPAKTVNKGKKGGKLSNKSSPRRIHQIHQPR